MSTSECLVLLLIILPLIKDVAQNKYHVISTRVDFYIVQYGFLIQGLGCIIMVVSQTVTVFILGTSVCVARETPC